MKATVIASKKCAPLVPRAQQHEDDAGQRPEPGDDEQRVVRPDGGEDGKGGHDGWGDPADGLMKDGWQYEGREQRRRRPDATIEGADQPFSAMTA